MPSANSFICKKIPRRKSAGFSRELSFFSKHLPNLSPVHIRKGPAFGSGSLSLCVFQRPDQSLRPTVVFHMNAPEYALYRHTEHSPLQKFPRRLLPAGVCFFRSHLTAWALRFFRSHLAAWALRFFQSRLSGSGFPLFGSGSAAQALRSLPPPKSAVVISVSILSFTLRTLYVEINSVGILFPLAPCKPRAVMSLKC